MKLHENKQLFRQAVQFAEQHKNIRAVYIEKDYWVTYALHSIFKNAIGKETVFKGGTALSKCFEMVARFSEDIDLIVLRHEGESNNKLTNKIKEISRVVAGVLPEVEIKDVTQKMGMNRKTAHTYAKEFNDDYGQVRDVIIVEATWLGYYEPYTTRKVSSYIYEMMMATHQEKIAAEYHLLPFEVQVLEPRRTVCEKIMSLVRFSYSDNPIEDLKNKIRHTYDLHQLLQQKELAEFFKSDDFDMLLLKVANDDVVSYRNNNSWLVHHPNDSLMFSKLENVWNEMKATYNNEFKLLVFGDFPPEKKILETLMMIRDRMVNVKWLIVKDKLSN